MLELQRQLLGDDLRNWVFLAALREVVRPGMVIADVGAGTGYLGLMALRYGAARCHFIECTPIVKLAREVARHNGLSERCRFYTKHSTQVRLPEKVDVILCETLGDHALDENIIETMGDATRRFLTEGGACIPEGLEIFAQPIIEAEAVRELDCWPHVQGEIDLGPVRPVALSRPYAWRVDPAHLGCEPQRLDVLDLRGTEPSRRQRDVQFDAPHDLTVHGVCLWWRARVFGELVLSTSPTDAATHWKQIILPLVDPVPVPGGRQILVETFTDTRYEVDFDMSWQVRCS